MATQHGSAAIGPDALDAWLVNLDAQRPGSAAALDAAERARAATFLRPQDGMRFAASRAALRMVLARYLCGEPGDLEFQFGPHGQPRVAGDEIRFSLARSGGLALIAVSRAPVGADLERPEQRGGLGDLAASRFAAREAARIAAGCCGPPTVSFYRHWTAKEAYLKAVGVGLAGLGAVEVVCGERPGICVAGRPVADWLLSTISETADYVAAIVGRTPVTSWRWLSAARTATPAGPAGCCPSPTPGQS